VGNAMIMSSISEEVHSECERLVLNDVDEKASTIFGGLKGVAKFRGRGSSASQDGENGFARPGRGAHLKMGKKKRQRKKKEQQQRSPQSVSFSGIPSFYTS
jgi:hypothetical protein